MNEFGNSNGNSADEYGTGVSGSKPYISQSEQYSRQRVSRSKTEVPESESVQYAPQSTSQKYVPASQAGQYVPQNTSQQYVPGNNGGQYGSQYNSYNQYNQYSTPQVQPPVNNPYYGNSRGNTPKNSGGGNSGNNKSDREKKVIIIIAAAILCLVVICLTIVLVANSGKNGGDKTSRNVSVQQAETTQRSKDDSAGEDEDETTESTTKETTTSFETAQARNSVKIGSDVAEVYCKSSRVSSSDVEIYLSKLQKAVREQGISFILVLADDSSYLNNTSTFLSNELSTANISSNADAIILSINLDTSDYTLNGSGGVRFGLYDRRFEAYDSHVSALGGNYSTTLMSTLVDYFTEETKNITTDLVPYADSLTTVNSDYTCHTESDTLSIRVIPSVSGTKSGQLVSGNTVNVYYIYNGWGYIDIKGFDGTRVCGWVSMDYMEAA